MPSFVDRSHEKLKTLYRVQSTVQHMNFQENLYNERWDTVCKVTSNLPLFTNRNRTFIYASQVAHVSKMQVTKFHVTPTMET